VPTPPFCPPPHPQENPCSPPPPSRTCTTNPPQRLSTSRGSLLAHVFCDIDTACRNNWILLDVAHYTVLTVALHKHGCCRRQCCVFTWYLSVRMEPFCSHGTFFFVEALPTSFHYLSRDYSKAHVFKPHPATVAGIRLAVARPGAPDRERRSAGGVE
jgi:hypothetical protein